MQDRRLRQFDEFGGDIEGPWHRLGRKRVEDFRKQLRFIAAHRPGHLRGSHLVQREGAGCFTPAVEIGFAVEGLSCALKAKSELLCFRLEPFRQMRVIQDMPRGTVIAEHDEG